MHFENPRACGIAPPQQMLDIAKSSNNAINLFIIPRQRAFSAGRPLESSFSSCWRLNRQPGPWEPWFSRCRTRPATRSSRAASTRQLYWFIQTTRDFFSSACCLLSSRAMVPSGIASGWAKSDGLLSPCAEKKVVDGKTLFSSDMGA